MKENIFFKYDFGWKSTDHTFFITINKLNRYVVFLKEASSQNMFLTGSVQSSAT